jgi:small subunit ribosomal protein S5
MNKRNTLYHEIIGRHGASSVLLKPAPVGTGIIAGGAIRAIVELAGFKDIYTKNLGSNTSLNMVQATLDGLLKQRHPSAIAALRDKNIKEL